MRDSMMPSVHPKLLTWLAATAIVMAGHVVLMARVDVRVEYDKKFDFKPMKTWAWSPDSPGDVKVARSQYDDKDAIKKEAEPIILDAVAAEMKQRGLQEARGAPDIAVTYYLLLTTGFSEQQMGQFLPSVPEWGIPPFPPATQALQAMNLGSLVLDLSARQDIVWRGVASAKLKMGTEPKKRQSLLREAVRGLLKKYPPR
jgi:hypothetical protein